MKAQRIASWLVILSLTFLALYIGKLLLRPLAIAVVITFLITTLSRFFQRFKIWGRQIPRWITNTAALLLIIGFLALCIDIMISTVNKMAVSSSEYQASLEVMGDQVLENLGLDDVPRVGTLLQGIDLKPMVASLGSGLTNFAGRLLLILIYVIFLMLEQELFRRKFRVFFEDEVDYQRANSILHRIAESVRTYLSVKAFTSLLTAILVYGVLTIIGLRFAIFWAFIVFLFNFIPNIGSWVATALPVLFAMVQFEEMSPVLYTLGSVAAIQLIIGNYIDPRMMGRTLNVSPLVVLFSLFLWGALWGVMGMVLAVPITVSLLIIFSQFPETRKIALFLSQSGKIASFDSDDLAKRKEKQEVHLQE